MVPHSGVGGWAPSPRKLSAAVAKIDQPTCWETSTTTGEMAFGAIWRSMMRRSLAPDQAGGQDEVALADTEYGATTTRMKNGLEARPTAIITLFKPGPSPPTIASANS